MTNGVHCLDVNNNKKKQNKNNSNNIKYSGQNSNSKAIYYFILNLIRPK